MTKPDLYIALFCHEDDVDVFTFYFVPDDKLKYPCPVKVAEHFKIECEPGTGQTFELARAYGPRMETLTASQVGSETLGPADWLHENEEDCLDVDAEGDGQPEAVSEETQCAESPTGRHVPDPKSIRPADGTGRNRGTDWLIDVNCLHCGGSGSMLIEPNDLQW